MASLPGAPLNPPDLIFVLEGDLEAVEEEVLDELGLGHHHAFHFGLGLVCLLVLVAICVYCT